MKYSLCLTLFILNSELFCSAQNDVLDTLNNLSDICQAQINDRLVVCKNTVHEKWFINETSAKNFAPEMKRKVTCCSNWDFIDCIEKSISKYCNDTDLNNAIPSLKNVVKLKTQANCTKYTIHSTQCNFDHKNMDQEIELAKMITESSNVSQDCRERILSSGKQCAERSAIYSGYNKNDWNSEKLQDKIKCCLFWSQSDCFLEFAKDQCSQEDYNVSHGQFMNFIEHHAKKECAYQDYNIKYCKNNSGVAGINLIIFSILIFCLRNY